MTQHLEPTRILDFDHQTIQDLKLQIEADATSPHEFLQQAHFWISQTIQPIYSVNEWQSISLTLQKQQGSCSQRMAILEGLARAKQIPTRIHSLWIDGVFWHGRFPRWTHPFIPHRILLMLPEFQIDSRWLPFVEIYGSMQDLASRADHGFTNIDETLFETIQQRPLDFAGELQHCDCDFDLSAFVIEDGGTYPSRDEVLHRFKSFQFTWRGIAFEWLYGNKSSRAIPA